MVRYDVKVLYVLFQKLWGIRCLMHLFIHVLLY